MYSAVLITLFAPAISAFLLDSFGLGSGIKTVTELDVPKYLGRWYQMYASESVVATFEKDALCVTADYSMSTDGSGKVIVRNGETLKTPNGTFKTINGYATTSSDPGKLTVNLETAPFPAPYWVIKLGPATFGNDTQYQYSVVTDNLKVTLFVLARDPETFKRDYNDEVVQFLKQQGFTNLLNSPVATYQGSDCMYLKP
ncbi:apolipoprotein D-like [Mizuhopecten yessoensis]|uniref:Apolipoprotein D n=1 Tax=Mizuhopecten yessoensis TaxID=6573 RepID=A0A210QZB0_MIZYE|nr:apolipoprotein D-like [Mizuhopecten yessoensis]OWF54090.1 Apolipoprotein D [Mizuhopecten yessoensis]